MGWKVNSLIDKSRHIPPLIGALALAYAPHLVHLPIWITAWCSGLWGYAVLRAAKNRPFPGEPFRYILTVLGLLCGFATYGLSFNRDVGVALLAIMVGLKPLEIGTYRDMIMTIFLCFFLVISNLLFSTGLPMTLYMFVSVAMTTAVLISLHHPGGAFRRHLGLAWKILLQALPLMVILFVLFPRLQGSLWGLPSRTSGTIGFSDELEPGSITELVSNSDIAFRAEFHGPAPAPSEMYWRGIVLWRFDNRKWTKGFTSPYLTQRIQGSRPFEYTVTLEPQNQPWLFALDIPVKGTTFIPIKGNTFIPIRSDGTIRGIRQIKEQLQYRLISFSRYRTGPLKPWERMGLYLPPDGNPQARVLAEKWSEQAVSKEQIVMLALGFFRANDFYYTLRAPLLAEDTVDQFLFETRKGYCEHYASSFAFLMRAAGLHARIVIGYLGGEKNPFGNYVVVRQSDAHAWVEVYLPSRGWTRVDPTSAVAPERVERGTEAALPPDERQGLPWFESGPLAKVWKQFRFGWDAVNILWDKNVLGYSTSSQRQFLSWLGIHSVTWRTPLKGFLIAIAFISVFIVIYFYRGFRPVSRTSDPVQAAYIRLCQRLEKAGIPRPPHLGPMDYLAVIEKKRETTSEEISEILNLYVRLRYGKPPDPVERKRFLTRARRFNPESWKNSG